MAGRYEYDDSSLFSLNAMCSVSFCTLNNEIGSEWILWNGYYNVLV